MAARKGDNDLVKLFIESGTRVDTQNVSKSSEEYQEQMAKVQKEYEDEVAQLQKDYSTMSEEKRKEYENVSKTTSIHIRILSNVFDGTFLGHHQ